MQPAAYCPYLVVETDLLSAKLIETPLLSFINHMTMVASKASVVVDAARRAGEDRAVLEFGTRRTHPDAAVDAAVAAYIAGCAATSNVRAHVERGIPMSGTMDHFAVQAWERAGVPRHETERAFFEAFHRDFAGRDVLLIDTYDTFGKHTGIRSAVAATGGKGPWGIRIDSNISQQTLRRARRLLDELGATETKIFVSGGMDEHAIADLEDAPVDGYGIGERIVTSPDAPVGVGAVGKLCEIRGRPTMKLSRGSGKATLPGRVQCWRTPGHDIIGLAHEAHEGTPLLAPVWSEEQGRPRPGRLRRGSRHRPPRAGRPARSTQAAPQRRTAAHRGARGPRGVAHRRGPHMSDLHTLLPFQTSSVDLSGAHAVGLVVVDPGVAFTREGPLSDPVSMAPMIQRIGEQYRALRERLGGRLHVLVFLDTHHPDIPEPPYPPHGIIGTGEELIDPELEWLLEGAAGHADPQGLHQRLRRRAIDRNTGANAFCAWVIDNALQQLVVTGDCTDNLRVRLRGGCAVRPQPRPAHRRRSGPGSGRIRGCRHGPADRRARRRMRHLRRARSQRGARPPRRALADGVPRRADRRWVERPRASASWTCGSR